MEKIFAGHSKLLQFDTGVDLTAMATKQIRYRKPDGTTGTWAATLNGTTIMEYQVTDQFNQLGVWELQPVAYSGSTRYYGEKILKLHVVRPA